MKWGIQNACHFRKQTEILFSFGKRSQHQLQFYLSWSWKIHAKHKFSHEVFSIDTHWKQVLQTNIRKFETKTTLVFKFTYRVRSSCYLVHKNVLNLLCNILCKWIRKICSADRKVESLADSVVSRPTNLGYIGLKTENNEGCTRTLLNMNRGC